MGDGADIPGSRGEIEERRYWPVHPESFHHLEPGDELTIEAWTKGNPEYLVTITERDQGHFIAERDRGCDVRIIPCRLGGKHGNVGGGNPWLLTDDAESRSLGEIKSFTVRSLAD